MANFLEQLVAEWYEFNGYFVRRNINVGPRARGGWECELDVIAFNPKRKHLIHLEPSMDSDRWDERQRRFKKKFEAGREHIPMLFESFQPLPRIDQVALFVYGSSSQYKQIGGGRILLIKEFMDEIRKGIQGRSVSRSAIPEQYVILRSLLFAAQYWK